MQRKKARVNYVVTEITDSGSCIYHLLECSILVLWTIPDESRFPPSHAKRIQE